MNTIKEVYEIKASGVDPTTEWEFLFGGEERYHATREAAQAAVDRLTATVPEAFGEFPDIAESIRYYVEAINRQDFCGDSLGLRDWREAQREALHAL